MRKLLLIGGTGFVGSHMAQYCSGRFDVVTTGREVDVRDAGQLQAVIARARPDDVVHLAAVTTLKESFENPRATYDINFGGTLNLLMALRNSGFAGRFLFVSSSEVYGHLGEFDLPVNETRLARPLSPYAVSKIASESLCYQWSQSEKFKIVVARPFNHIGPGQSERFAIADFGRQITMIKLGLALPVIRVGDIETTRDFTDVRDIVSSYERLLNLGQNGETYNVCSGSERSIRSLIERMCQLAGVSVEIQTDSERFRLSEQRRVRGDNGKIMKATGWSAAYSMDQTLTAILDDWVARLGTHAS
ncbi:GDP-6-deoxy-D-mannose reductase [Candidatus Magnetaquicoccaceae bacterium FCR-1]|uniref:GDP-6-deoxy-D-mannose reductase n=1 Tax=Candidatus Magnetaquiglobus chichijimensis TaxID=3141448 RepID=A0ABQ0CBV0_9PROT